MGDSIRGSPRGESRGWWRGSEEMTRDRQIIDRCGWSQVKTALNERSRTVVTPSEVDPSEPISVAWVLYECVSCGRPTLREEWYHEGLEEGSIETLLPTSERDDSALPQNV